MGFTITELLIALMILGEIATFTIPKVLQTQQNSKYNAMAKEVAGSLSDAFIILKSKTTVSATTKAVDFGPYLNYVKIDTGPGTVQDAWGSSYNCNSSNPCYVLHNGGYLLLWNQQFTGTTNLHRTIMIFDPDGSGIERGVWYVFYYNGRLTTLSTCLAGTIGEAGCPYGSAADPSYFKW
ncbi:MAG TPA: type II secretion system protein [Coleofasciculaceae cyanobacterium]